MNSTKLNDMIKGWYIGGFAPTAYHTHSCEVALKKYNAGETEPAHFHKISTEITLVVSGKVYMVGREWIEGDIIVLNPGDVTSFEAITNVVNVVVKIPGALNDKFLI